MSVLIAVDGRAGRALAEALRDAGREVVAVVSAADPALAAADTDISADSAQLLAELARADTLVVTATRAGLTAPLVAACDRYGVRIIALASHAAEDRLARSFGVASCSPETPVEDMLAAAAVAETPSARGRVIAVWGPAGAPGRTRVAVELACELARDGRRVGLIDADSHAPSVAVTVGLADEGPGFAAACRAAERGSLTAAELTRIALPLQEIEVLAGINRPARWPELSEPRVRAVLETSRTWVEEVVIDVASALEADEEIVSDMSDGPRRNAATLAVLADADVVVAVLSPDPTGVARFVRAYGELRAASPGARVHVVVNKARSQVVGLDVRGQLSRTLQRYCGIDRVWLLPWDAKACDAAVLAGRPIAHVRGRSAFAAALRRFVGDALEKPAAARATRAVLAGRRRSMRIAAAP